MDLRVVGMGGAGLGLVVASWQVVSAAALGATPLFVPVAALVQLVVLVLVLRRTAATQAYGAQVGTGVAVSAVAGAIIAATSVLVTTALFPGLLAELQAQAPGATVVNQAVAGLVGTLATGLVGSLVVAAFVRRRDG